MSPIILPFRGVAPQIDATAYIAPGASVVGDVRIAPQASVWFGCVLRGDDNHIEVGPRTNIQDGTVVHVMYQTHPTLIGADVVIGHGARLHGCALQDACMIGIGAVLLDGVVVEPGAIVAAGAVVTPNKRVPAGEIWAGNPARLLRKVSEEERGFIDWDSRHYAELAGHYRNHRNP